MAKMTSWQKTKQQIKSIDKRNSGMVYCYNEYDFSNWFKLNYRFYDIKEIIKHDRFFPDVIARNNLGETLRIELEFYANDFVAHKHDANSCDLIISYAESIDRQVVRGLPVIALYTASSKRSYIDHCTLLETDFGKMVIPNCTSVF